MLLVQRNYLTVITVTASLTLYRTLLLIPHQLTVINSIFAITWYKIAIQEFFEAGASTFLLTHYHQMPGCFEIFTAKQKSDVGPH